MKLVCSSVTTLSTGFSYFSGVWRLRKYPTSYLAGELTAVDTPHMVGQFGYVLAIEQPKILQKKHYFIVIIELERENIGVIKVVHVVLALPLVLD